MPDVPPIFRLALVSWVNPPLPSKVEETVNVLVLARLLVKDPVTDK